MKESRAYINGTFKLEEYDTEKEIIEKEIEMIEHKIKDCEICEDLSFTPEDILIKRDIDYINQILYPKEYEEKTYLWKDYTREEKADLIMRYIDKIILTKGGKNHYKVDEIYFRESIAKPCNELYDVGYFEATYYYNDKVMFFNGYEERRIVRIFPLEDYRKMDKLEQIQLGVIYVKDWYKSVLENEEDVFEYLPEHGIKSRTYEFDEETKKLKKEIEEEIKEFKMKNNISSQE